MRRCSSCGQPGHYARTCGDTAVYRPRRGTLGRRGEMDWDEIGQRLKLSREAVRQIALGALTKLRLVAPDLGELFAARLRVLDARSPAAQCAEDGEDIEHREKTHYGVHA